PGQAGVGLGPLAVYADLAAANELIDQAPGRALELQQQEVVQPLAVPVLRDPDQSHAGRDVLGCRHGGCTYTITGRDNVLISQGLPGQKPTPENPEEPLPHPTGVTMLAGAEGGRILPRACEPANTGRREAGSGP